MTTPTRGTRWRVYLMGFMVGAPMFHWIVSPIVLDLI